MIDRRSFLIGTGSILTVPFIDKAEWFLRNRNTVVPLIEPTEQTTELFFVRLGDQYELRLDGADFGELELTHREVLAKYHYTYMPKERAISLSEFRQIYHEHGITPKMLDEVADPMTYIDLWSSEDANSAKAYHYLEGLDLFGAGGEKGLKIGDLNFVSGSFPSSDYLGVISHNPISASLLQARLIELGHDTIVKIE